MPKYNRIMVWSDPHCPFMHRDAVPFLKYIKRQFKPDLVICNGDEMDAHAISDWPKDPDGHSAGDEYAKALDQLKQLYKVFPVVKSVTSNHTDRVWRRAFSSGLPNTFIKPRREIMQAPDDWEWASHWDIEGKRFEHGEGFSGETAHIKAAKANMMSTTIGHIHSHAGINYIANIDKLIFAFNVGCLIDKSAYAFGYGKHIKAKPILGCGLIEHDVPYFVPMMLNKAGRWVQ